MASLSNQPSKKSLRNSGGSSGSQGTRNSGGQTVKFARRTSSGKYVSLSKEDDVDMSSDLSGDYMNYTVHIPLTPDNQPVDASIAMSHTQMAGAKGSTCSMPACDGKIMDDEKGVNLIPCECRYRICRDCYLDAQKETGLCPSCNEPYKIGELYEDGSKRDHNTRVFETNGTYGVSNTYWPQDDGYGDNRDDGLQGGVMESKEKPWKPLSWKTPIPSSIMIPYRILILLRLVVLGFFLHWRVMHPNQDAIWLWAMSIICEIWFSFSWLIDQIPKIFPINRSTDLQVLHEKFDSASPCNPTGRSDLPGVDLFVYTADPENEPPLVTANTMLSILAADYPVEKLACYISDDGSSLLTFETLAETASFAYLWVPFCRKHNIEQRNPNSYFNLKVDATKNKSKLDFVKDRRKVNREYDEFKVRVNGLPDSIRRRSDAFNAREEMKMMKHMKETGAVLSEPLKVVKATWMADGTHWPGTWASASSEHTRSDHAGILQVMLNPPRPDPLMGSAEEHILDFTDVDTRLPMFVYVSREKRPGYDDNKKAGAMNALVRVSAILSNGPFVLTLDCDHYIHNRKAIREGMCFMMDKGGEDICYIQFPQRFDGIDPSDRYANHNTVFFDGNMRALDGIQGPFYVGTGCMFRRFALYGFDPRQRDNNKSQKSDNGSEMRHLKSADDFDPDLDVNLLPKRFGNSSMLAESIPVAEFRGRPLADDADVKYGRPPGALRVPREPLDATTVAEAISVISCWYEDKTEWGVRVGWIYGSLIEDVVTGYRKHNRGWRSVYCITKRDAFRGSAPINLTDRLHQVLCWATGSVEIFFSKHNAFLGSQRLQFLQRLSYLNVGIHPFSSIFLVIYCFLPALSLFSGYFIVQSISISFLIYLLIITVCVIMLAVLEIKWSGINVEDWWRNEQFWLISGTSAHLAAVVQALLTTIVGIELPTSKSVRKDNDDKFAELYIIKWSPLMIPPIVIGMVNIIAITVAFIRIVFAILPKWSRFMGGALFSFWVLAHLYPFAKGLMGRRRKTPTIVFVWSGLIAITLSLLWVAIYPPPPPEL